MQHASTTPTTTFTPLTRLARLFGAPALLARPRRRAQRSSPALGTPGVVAAPAPARPPSHAAPQFAGGARGGTSILWLRGSDLRLHDNAALTEACANAGAMLPVAVLDPRAFRRTSAAGPPPRAGPYRAKFILAALADLRRSLRAKRSDLIVCVGEPENVLPALAARVGARRVVCTSEPAFADAAVEAAVETALSKATDGRARLTRVWAGTVADPRDLGGIDATPPTFAAFKKATAGVAPRAPAPAPSSLPPLPARSPPAGDLPTLDELVGDADAVAAAVGDGAAAGAALEGGETAGLAAAAASAANTSSRVAALGPWLAAGCVSPRRLLAAAETAADRAAVAAELAWRDFFRFTTARLSAVRLKGRGAGQDVGGVVAA